MFNPETTSFSLFMPSFETAVRSLKLVPITAPVQSDIEIETAITAPVNASRLSSRAARASLGAGAVRYSFTVTDFHRLPFAGLPAHPSTTSDSIEPYRGAAGYVHRIL
jgi:hypothetical protein